MTCQRCRTDVVVPDEMKSAFCIHCGNALDVGQFTSADTVFHLSREGITPSPTPRLSVRKEIPTEAPRHYECWEDFRAHSPALHAELLTMATRPLPDLREADRFDPPPAADVSELGQLVATLFKPGENRLVNIGFGWATMLLGLIVAMVTWFVVLPSEVPRGDPIASVGVVVLMGGSVFALGFFYTFFRKPFHPQIIWVFRTLLADPHRGFGDRA